MLREREIERENIRKGRRVIHILLSLKKYSSATYYVVLFIQGFASDIEKYIIIKYLVM